MQNVYVDAGSPDLVIANAAGDNRLVRKNGHAPLVARAAPQRKKRSCTSNSKKNEIVSLVGGVSVIIGVCGLPASYPLRTRAGLRG
jgi:hypothetical protein